MASLVNLISREALDYIKESNITPDCISIYVEESKNSYLSNILNTVIFCELDTTSKSLKTPIKVFEGIDDDRRRSVIAIAKSVSERIYKDYNPEGYEKKSVESRRILWPELPRIVYRTRISLKRKTENSEAPFSD